MQEDPSEVSAQASYNGVCFFQIVSLFLFFFRSVQLAHRAMCLFTVAGVN